MAKSMKDLDLMDDFLFQETLGNPQYGPQVAKLLLGTILKRKIENVKVITQRVETTGDPKKRGIRMDVYIEEEAQETEKLNVIYDIEIQKDDTKELPQRSRYYQALIDSKLLLSGEVFGALKPVWIILITPVDIFGYDRMCYTFENLCVESPEISLKDGAKRVFLYSRGTVERDEELYQLLHYLESSREENAVNEVTRSLHQIVEKVKQNHEVGVRYMKAVEYEEYITKKATREGMEKGEKRFGKLALLLMKENKYEDLERASKDKEYREKLFQEFNI